jgi:hypothetical protein
MRDTIKSRVIQRSLFTQRWGALRKGRCFYLMKTKERILIGPSVSLRDIGRTVTSFEA